MQLNSASSFSFLHRIFRPKTDPRNRWSDLLWQILCKIATRCAAAFNLRMLPRLRPWHDLPSLLLSNFILQDGNMQDSYLTKRKLMVSASLLLAIWPTPCHMTDFCWPLMLQQRILPCCTLSPHAWSKPQWDLRATLETEKWSLDNYPPNW